jgi:peptidyl-dipeptidase Dcp
LSQATLPAFTSDSPFFEPSSLPFGVPPFDRILDDHYQPAIEEGMRQHLAEIEAIAQQSDAPTFDNTIVPFEESGDLLNRVLRAFGAVTAANTNDTLQAIQTEQAPKLAAHHDAVFLNAALFRRVRAIYERRCEMGLTDEQRFLVERLHLDFERSGALLSDEDKAKFTALNQEESRLTNDFQNRLLAATKSSALVIEQVVDIEGLSEGDVAAAAETAKERELANKWVLALQNTTQQPWQESLKRRDTRRRLFEAALHRADHGDENDTRALVLRLAELRAEHARLLGHDNAAEYVLGDQMAKTPEAAIQLLTDLGAPAVAMAREEAKRIQRLIDQNGAGFPLRPWDWQYYAEQVRKAEFELDEAQIKPYFELDRVLHDGVFFAATQLYGITFAERTDLPVYHPEVRVYDVFDADGSSLALFYTDFFKRDNKTGGAWMDSLVDQSRLLGQKAVVINVCNYTKPAPGQPALLSFDDVTTLFHEFGHTLHGILSSVEYPTLSGTAVPRDFVEFPSQFNEHWALEPSVFATYAKHYQTGEPMPQPLVERIKKARTFNQGFALTEYIAAALVDMAWHTVTPETAPRDVDAFEAEALREYGMDIAEVPPRYATTYFAHIWDGGYQAGYFAYLWAEVLDHDAFAWFKENGGMTRENGQRFRETILARGGTADPAALFRRFRGRDPSVEALLVERGFKSEPGDR